MKIDRYKFFGENWFENQIDSLHPSENWVDSMTITFWKLGWFYEKIRI
jgi:hypothetical protein